MPVGVFLVDGAGRVRLWNRAMETLAAPRAEAEGRPAAEVLPRFTDPMRATDFASLILEGALERGEAAEVEDYPLRGPDGTVRIVRANIVPVPGREGGRRGALCVWEDTTRLKRKAEKELRSARTSALASFGASIAHEIRNPLNSIALNLQLLQEGIRDPVGGDRDDLIEESGAILEEIENLNRVVGHLLRFAQDPAPFLDAGDASEAVARALKLLAGEARKAGVRVLREIRPLENVRLDEDMLSRAVYNIGLNAIQAMEEGGTLKVRTEARPLSALIEIADTGPGVSPEEREKIFGLFYSGRAEGTGIGLPIAHRIVEGHGGYITVDSSPEGGALFQVHLPWAGKAGETASKE
jgi:two-component system sensor histidine kinase HydH